MLFESFAVFKLEVFLDGVELGFSDAILNVNGVKLDGFRVGSGDLLDFDSSLS